jgi:DNA integrity scanning protein DisA with diadenylate cyclase activity
MNTAFENMTQEENDFFERMKTAPESERDIFRKALNIMMTCFGENPPGAVLVMHVMRDEGSMDLHGFNVMEHEMAQMLAFAAQHAMTNSKPADATVQ